MYLLDTNILIYYLNDNVPENQSEKLNNIIKNHFNISVITKMEFLGFRNYSSHAFRMAKEFINYANCYNLNEEIVEMVITIRRKQKIKLPDAIIAATALINKSTLVTRNTIDFKDIEEIHIYNPFK